MEKARLGITRFFTGYFKNFHKLLLTNLLFAVPLFGFVWLFRFINQATGLNTSAIDLLAIIPVFPFFAGVTVITRNIAREDSEITVFKSYFKAVVGNLPWFLLHSVVLYAAIFLTYVSLNLYWRLIPANGVFAIPFGIMILLAIAVLFIFYYIPVMTVTFDLSVKNIYKNSALMALGELKNNFFATLGLFLLFIFCATLFLASPTATVLWVALIALMALIVPATASYIINFYIYKDVALAITDKNAKTTQIEQERRVQEAKRNGEILETKPDYSELDFSGLDLDPKKDGEEYLFFGGKMIKRKTLIKMRDEQEAQNE